MRLFIIRFATNTRNRIFYSNIGYLTIFIHMKLLIPDIHPFSMGKCTQPTDECWVGLARKGIMCENFDYIFRAHIYLVSFAITPSAIDSLKQQTNWEYFRFLWSTLHWNGWIYVERNGAEFAISHTSLHPLPRCHSCTFSAPENCFVAKKKHRIQRQALRKQLSMR